MNLQKATSIFLLLLFGFIVKGQGIYDEISNLNKQDKVEECFSLIDTYEAKYLKEEKWDSLIILYQTIIPIHERRSGPEKVEAITTQAWEAAQNHLQTEDELFLNVKLLHSSSLSKVGNLAEASKVADEVIQSAIKIDNGNIQAKALIQKSWSELRQYQVKEAKQLAEEALELKEYIAEDTVQLLLTYQALSISHNFLHETEKAIEYNKMQLSIIEKKFGIDHPNVGIVSGQIAATLKESGQFKESLKYQLKAIKILEKHYLETGVTYYVANEYYNLALLYDRLGEVELAEDYLLLSKEIGGEDYYSIDSYHNFNSLTQIALFQDKIEQAKSYNDQALQIITQLEPPYSYFHLSALGYKVEILSRLDQIEASYKLGKEVFEKVRALEDGSPKELIYMANTLYKIALMNKDTSSAIEIFKIYEEANKDYYSPLNPEYITMLYLKMGFLYDTGRKKEIPAIIHEVLNAGNPEGNNSRFSKVIPNSQMLEVIKLWIELKTEELKDGLITIDEYKNIVEDIESYLDIHFHTIRSNARISKEGSILKSIYKPLIELAVEEDSRSVIEYMEKVKSLLTRVLLQNHLIKPKTDDIKIVDAIKENLKSTQDSFDLKIYSSIVEQMESFQAYKDSLLSVDKDNYIARFGLNSWSDKNLAAILEKKEVLIQYLQIDSSLYYIAISSSEHEVRKINYNKVLPLLTEYLEDRDQLKSRQLYDMLFPGSLHEQYDKWIILPDSKLHLLNFEELIDAGGQYLLNSKSIRLGYSSTVLERQRLISENIDARNDILSLTPGFADRLKKMNETRRDSSWNYYLQQPFLINLSEQIKNIRKSEALTEEEASESNFKNKSQDFKILHFGTHGLLNENSPLFSKLVLVNDSLEDGYLHIYEIYGQNLNSELAVLSACNSGKGKVESSDGIVSLTQAFTHAGCPSVLMTLWEVDEKSTSEILSLFYDNLQKGQNKSVALRNAKLDFLEGASYQYQDPYYWAGLVIIGNDEPLFSSNFGPMQLLIYGVIFLLLVLVIWRGLRKNV